MAFPREPCPKCGTDIGATLWFSVVGDREAYCSGCGSKVIAKCEKCGTSLIVKERFCSRCGTKNPIFVETP